MSEIRTLLSKMRRQRWTDDRELLSVTEEQMNLPTSFTRETMMTGKGGQLDDTELRFQFLRRADHLEEHTIQLEDMLANRFNVRRSQSDRYWAANQEARGDLYAALCGLSDADLDRAPTEPEGEWPLRQILEHLITNEVVFAPRILQAVENKRAGKPYGDHPPFSEFEQPDASFLDLMIAFDQAREETLEMLQDLSDQDLRAPMIYMGMDVDVRFILLGYAMHEREHMAHIRKWRQQCGLPFSEAARLEGLCWQRWGRLEGVLAGVSDDLLDRDPGDGEWTVRQILRHLASSEQYFDRVIRETLECEAGG